MTSQATYAYDHIRQGRDAGTDPVRLAAHDEMTGEEALQILELLSASGVDAWVDGGWGVDALVGRETRSHSDLDLVITREDVERASGLLGREGFSVGRDWLPTAIAFVHPDGREVDLHPVDRTQDGGGDQIQLDGITRWHYEPPVGGTISGHAVRCCSLSTQVRAHLGYEPGVTDRADMALLREQFGVELPPPYGRASEPAP